jgi:hypothetical protein
MSEDRTKTEGAGAEPDPAAEGEPKAAERFDEEGLPLDREPTIDDVRGGEGSGRTIAVGCSILVVLAIAVFWLIRAGILG